jgi:hypothetical protein
MKALLAILFFFAQPALACRRFSIWHMTSPNPVRSLARTPKPRLRHLRRNSHCPRLSVALPRGCGRRQWRWEIQRGAANPPPPPRSPACGCAQTLPDHDLNFVALADRSVLGIRLCAIFAAKLLLAGHYLMSFIPDGRSIHAVGGSLEASASQGFGSSDRSCWLVSHPLSRQQLLEW